MRSDFLHSVYTKIAFAAICGGMALAAGMYAGDVMLGRDHLPELQGQDNQSFAENSEQFVTFEQGDLFPLEDFVRPDSTAGSFEDLLNRKNTILLFVSLEMEPCHQLLRFWSEHLRERLLPGVQVVACMESSATAIPPEYEGLFDGMTLVLYDGVYWRREYNMKMWPAVIGVDDSGFVTHIQLGYRKYMDSALMERFFVPIPTT